MKIVVTGAAGHLGGMETESKLPLFREAFVKRRCLIPATRFFK